MSFAYGIHQCDPLLQRIPGLRRAVPVEKPPFKEQSDAYGAFELPVTW